VTRTKATFTVEDYQRIRLQLLSWAAQFSSCSFLDNHQYKSTFQQQECLAGVGVVESIQCNAGNAFERLSQFMGAHPNEWFFGHLGYDLKNETEELVSAHPDHVGFPDVCFFIPQIVVQLSIENITIESYTDSPVDILEQIKNVVPAAQKRKEPFKVQARFLKDAYIQTIQQIREHIRKGDCYELNFCQEFYAEQAQIEPLVTYQKLSNISPNPFSVFYRLDHRYLLCASPERFLMRKGNNLFSQPIKGTAARNLGNELLDEQQKTELLESAKQRSENVMVVDLVRNDLSKICEEGTVQVNELFGIYTYPQVHQMISTITGIVRSNLSFADIIKATFPMGSMTGAPKKRVMQLIEQYERTKRGLFSGAVGYIAPNGDFDFNVVIRSIFYNEKEQYVSYQVGGGITFQSDAEDEYEECMLKAMAMKAVLSA